MADRTLRGCRILIVEDEYMLAEDLRIELTNAGATVEGMVATVADALDAIRKDLDGVLLDVNLGGENAYPVADRLIERNVPFIFTTGYDASAIPARFSGVARCEKPVDLAEIITTMGREVAA